MQRSARMINHFHVMPVYSKIFSECTTGYYISKFLLPVFSNLSPGAGWGWSVTMCCFFSTPTVSTACVYTQYGLLEEMLHNKLIRIKIF